MLLTNKKQRVSAAQAEIARVRMIGGRSLQTTSLCTDRCARSLYQGLQLWASSVSVRISTYLVILRSYLIFFLKKFMLLSSFFEELSLRQIGSFISKSVGTSMFIASLCQDNMWTSNLRFICLPACLSDLSLYTTVYNFNSIESIV